MIKLGILGLGYLGRAVLSLPGWAPDSWGTCRHPINPLVPVPGVYFDWADPTTWGNLPLQMERLLFCIPPLGPDLQTERNRLDQWGSWIVQHRPRLSRLVYVSSTSVYANQPGCYDETSPTNPSGLKGQLRLLSEQILAPYFDLKVIRPGAIYGPGRGVGERLRCGLAIPSDSGPVHRIHVTDLARLCQLALTEADFPKRVNGVDLEPAPSLEVALWLLKQANYQGLELKQEVGFQARQGVGAAKNRQIKNTELSKGGFQYQYPTYQAGYTQEGADEQAPKRSGTSEPALP